MSSRASYLRNRTKVLIRSKARYRAKRKEILAQKAEYYQRNRMIRIAYALGWNQKNRTKKRQYNSAWDRRYPEKRNAITRNRYARKKQARGSHTADDVKRLFNLQKAKCAHPWCCASLKSGYHVDHKEALAIGGSNDPSNLQLLCATCNHSKHTKHPIDLANRYGFLL